MPHVPSPGRAAEQRERRNAYVDQRTKDRIAGTFPVLKHARATMESARQLLEDVRYRRLRLPNADDAQSIRAASDGERGETPMRAAQ
jgi:hypothetical protein